MLQNKAQSIEAIQTIARSLGELNERVVYVGGAVPMNNFSVADVQEKENDGILRGNI